MSTYPAPKASIDRTAARRFADSATHSAFAPLQRGPRIVTSFVYPPIPIRCCDWQAWFDHDPEGLHGYGATEDEAIADLQMMVEEHDEMLRERADADGTRHGFDAPSGGRL